MKKAILVLEDGTTISGFKAAVRAIVEVKNQDFGVKTLQEFEVI